MDMSSAWLSQLEMQDHQGLMSQYQMIKPYNEVGDNHFGSFTSDVETKNTSLLNQTFQIPSNVREMPNIKRIPSFKTTNNVIKKLAQADENQNTKPKPTSISDIPNTFTISFGDLKPKDEVIALGDSFGYENGTKKGPTMIRNRIQLQDHMLAERKRREKLARRFLYLSSLLPGLKKMDKATVLEDAANYIQELQCRLRKLEGSSSLQTNNLESDVSAKKPKLCCSNDEGFSPDEAKFVERHSFFSPEIEVRMSGIYVLVRIYCHKNYMPLLKVFRQMQNLDLSVTSSSTFPFGSSNIIITIVAKKKNDNLMTSSDLVKSLKLAISEEDMHSEVKDFHSNKLEFEYNELDEN
ncbi:transcription factor bHLH25-like [Rutidosis leptorrhynchoides]|uniref:transcription factor bHLH25-like n=1 Tax=Rutidosis leptorrhynchoides TaxID=125765 RepID=UPI003A99CDD0